MQLPFKYDNIINDLFILKTIRELNEKKPIEEDISNLTMECTSVDIPYEDIMTFENDSGVFTQTFFDQTEECDLANSHDSLFAETIDYYGSWSGPPISKDVLLKSHDCMWAGHCGSNEHKDDCDKAMHKLWAGCLTRPKHPLSSQQSLLKSSLKNAGVPVINLLSQTPPTSDEDESLILGPRLCNFDEDDYDLLEYFYCELDAFNDVREESSESSSEDSESEEEPEDQAGPSNARSNVTSVRSNIQATQNDHSYFKDKNSSMIMSDLGIDTPSDSGGSTPPRSRIEEEIDVVSVPDKKYPVANRMAYIPPTNTQNRGARNIQRPLDTVMVTGRNINNNTNNKNGLKIMLPAKRAPPAINYHPPAKRRAVASANDNNAKPKRTRQTRANLTTVRRRSNNSQDVETYQTEVGKRSIHNSMERMRREDLRGAFNDLRRLVPEVVRKDRAAKVVILREAAKYCTYLTNMHKSTKQHEKDLKYHQKKLKKKVSYLRRKAAIQSGRLAEH